MDDGKGTVTSFGAGGYDRRILQYYMPVGTSYRFTSGGWSFRPTLEYDPLLLGKVKSDLAQVNPATYDNITNRQDPFRGFGLRAEFLMGPADPEPFGWKLGVRAVPALLELPAVESDHRFARRAMGRAAEHPPPDRRRSEAALLVLECFAR
ncbi:MAG: hypothetical protein WDN72_10105 [Alphaproteobacteria bacterium]